MSTALTRAEDAPTHKLTIKLDEGSYKVFYLTEKEADWMAKNINSPDRFISLPKSIDSEAPSFYPKTWARMGKMTHEEIESRRNRYVNPEKIIDAEKEKKQKEETALVRSWIDGHPTEYESLLNKALETLSGRPGMWHSASKGVKKSLVQWEAWRMVYEMVTPESA